MKLEFCTLISTRVMWAAKKQKASHLSPYADRLYCVGGVFKAWREKIRSILRQVYSIKVRWRLVINVRICEASCSMLSEYCWPFHSQTSILILMYSTESLENLAPKELSPRLLYQSWLDVLASHHTIVAFNSDLAIDRAYTRSRVPTPLR
jgi:hypothetical protein